MPWELVPGGGYRCSRHEQAFGPLETCAACIADPGPPPDAEVEEVAVTPEGCLSGEDLERRAVEKMGEIDAALRKLNATKVKKLNLYNTIAKLNDNWIKAARLAGEYSAVREKRFHVKRLEARDRERKAKGGGR